VPYTTRDIAAQFTRQFLEENGTLVYRRHGRGPAYQVTDEQVQSFVDEYMRRTRIARLSLFLATIVLGGGGALLLADVQPLPSDGMIAAWAIGLVVVLVGAFVWAELRSQTSPERVLGGSAPISAEIDNDEWTRRQLEAVPWINFVILPLVGLFIVWAFRDDVDAFGGWGRLIWLVPIAMTMLALVQGLRKWRTARPR
jgi:hypothetical protein